MTREGRRVRLILGVSFLLGIVALLTTLLRDHRPTISAPRIVPQTEGSAISDNPPPVPENVADNPSPARPSTGWCDGRVVTDWDGKPVPNVRVLCRLSAEVWRSSGAESDADGYFRIEFPQGEEPPKLLFLHDQLAPAEVRADPSSPMLVRLTAGMSIEGFVLIFGDETPVADARVIVRGSSVSDGRLLPGAPLADWCAPDRLGLFNWRETRTDENGAFRISGVAGERVYVSAGKDGFAEIIAEKALQPFGPRPDHVCIHLAPAWVYAIKVVDAKSKVPIKGLSVREVSRSTDGFGRAPLRGSPDFVSSTEAGVYVARPFQLVGDYEPGGTFSIMVACDGYAARSVEVVPVPFTRKAALEPLVVEMQPLDSGVGDLLVHFPGLPSEWKGLLPLHLELARFDNSGIPFVEKYVPQVEGRSLRIQAGASKHRVRVWPYSVGGPIRKDVEVVEGHKTEIDVQVEPAILEIRVIDEAGAELDGVEFHWEADEDTGLHQRVSRFIYAESRYRLLFPAGTIRLMVRRDGFQPTSITTGLTSGRVNSVEAVLRRIQ